MARKTGMLRAFGHRNFRILFPATLISNTGTWAQNVAQDWLVLQLSHSALVLGLVTALQFAPTLIFSTWGGLLADRYPKRNLLVFTNLGMASTAAILGFLVQAKAVELWHVYLLAFALGTFGAVDAPIRQAFNSELVGSADVGSAIGLNSANFNVGRLLGPALSGFLIEWFGTGPSFIINSVSYIAVVMALLAMRTGELEPVERVGKDSRIRDAFAYLRTRPDIIWVMVAVFAASTFGLNFQIFNALMATEEFKIRAGSFGILGTAVAIGSLSGALLAARLEAFRTPRNITLWMVAFGLSLLAISRAPTYLGYGIALPASGFLALMGMISANSYVQTTTEPTLRGRVMGIYIMVFLGGTPLGSTLLGVAAQTLGIRATIFGCGVITVLGAGLAFIILRRSRKAVK